MGVVSNPSSRLTPSLSRFMTNKFNVPFRFSALSPGVQGAIWMILSAIGWAVMVSVARGLKDDLHTFNIVFFRSVFALAFFMPWLWRNGFGALRTERPGMHLARGLSGLAALYLLFGALVFIPTGEVAAITFLRPLIASAFVILFMGEPSKTHRWIAVAIGLTGAYIIVRPGVSEVSPGQLLAIAAVVAMVVTSLTIKSLARTEHPDTIAMYQVVVFTTLSLPPAILYWQTPTVPQLGLLVLMGFAGMVTQRWMMRAYAAADATVVLPFEYTRLPIAALFGLVLFSEFPDIWTWTGGTVIFAATLYMARKEAAENKTAKRDTANPPAA